MVAFVAHICDSHKVVDDLALINSDPTEVLTHISSSLPHSSTSSSTTGLEFAANLHDGETLMHVDTGANGNVICMSNELHNVVSSTVLCQTAKLGDADKVGYMGTLYP